MGRMITVRAEGDAGLRHPSSWTGLRQVYGHMSPKLQRQLQRLLALMLLNAVAELGTIGSVLPLLALISHPESLGHYLPIGDALRAVGAATPRELLIATSVIFVAFATIAGILRLQLARSTFDFGYGLAHELTLAIQSRLLSQPYSFHIQRNTSTLISALDRANILVFDVGLPLIQATSATIISIFIAAILVAVDPVAAFVAAMAFSTVYILASKLTRARLAANSEQISRGINERLKIVQESLGGVRDVIIDGSQNMYLELFERENSKLCRARANNAVIALAPRFIVETIGIVAIAAVALAASQREGGFPAAIPVLGAIALGAQRLLPLVQQVYKGWSSASGHLSVIGETVELLLLPIDAGLTGSIEDAPLRFREKIEVMNLGFTYPDHRSPTLEQISFDVPAGSSVAIVGDTGSGKSTLVDLLMGLLDPETGSIAIDGAPLSSKNRRRWQHNIAHVPQSVFLADASIARNIALSIPDKDPDQVRIIEAAKVAQLHEFIMSLPAGYETHVGERGIRLSGGQRQRLGMARAVYKNVPVLVLDEATSALDEVTEGAVIAALDRLRQEGRTIIIIAHRRSTIRHCDLIVRLKQGRIIEFGATSGAVGAAADDRAARTAGSQTPPLVAPR